MRNEINQLTKELPFTPKTFMEIGSRDGKDTDIVAKYWNLNPEDCYIIEAYPALSEKIKEEYPYQVFSFAASDVNDHVLFNAVVSEHQDRVGMSSLLDHLHDPNYVEKVLVETKRMEDFPITPDLLKLDVEGHAYSVLLGFGDKITQLKAIQVETEKIQLWKDQKVHDDIKSYLEEKGFELVSIYDAWDAQHDCLFINKSAS